MDKSKAFYHLPGLFEFYELYRVFLPVFREHRDWFYDWCDIGSIYGAPDGGLWGGGRVECSDVDPKDVLELMREYGISARLTMSNSLLEKKHLADRKCNALCQQFNQSSNGIIVHSDLLAEYLRDNYPDMYLVSSTTKVQTDFDDFAAELDRHEFRYVVPDFRLNIELEKLDALKQAHKDKTEFLCNECCWFECSDRKRCYESVSRMNLGEDSKHVCTAPKSEYGYRFSDAMKNKAFIGIDDIVNKYMPMGFSNFKIEGRGLGSALILEFLLYYMTKPEYHLRVREEIYLDNTLDLF